MDHNNKDWIDTLTFELTLDQVLALNKILPDHRFKFRPFDEAMRNLSKLKRGSRIDIPPLGGKTGYGNKRPAETPRDVSYNEYSTPAVTSNAPSVADFPINPMQSSLDLLSKMKDIITKEFPRVKNEFDFEILERGINNGYYINLEEFKVACRQVIRALAAKHKELDFSYLMNFEEAPPKQLPIKLPQEDVQKIKSVEESKSNYYATNKLAESKSKLTQELEDLFDGDDIKSYSDNQISRDNASEGEDEESSESDEGLMPPYEREDRKIEETPKKDMHQQLQPQPNQTRMPINQFGQITEKHLQKTAFKPIHPHNPNPSITSHPVQHQPQPQPQLSTPTAPAKLRDPSPQSIHQAEKGSSPPQQQQPALVQPSNFAERTPQRHVPSEQPTPQFAPKKLESPLMQNEELPTPAKESSPTPTPFGGLDEEPQQKPAKPDTPPTEKVQEEKKVVETEKKEKEVVESKKKDAVMTEEPPKAPTPKRTLEIDKKALAKKIRNLTPKQLKGFIKILQGDKPRDKKQQQIQLDLNKMSVEMVFSIAEYVNGFFPNEKPVGPLPQKETPQLPSKSEVNKQPEIVKKDPVQPQTVPEQKPAIPQTKELEKSKNDKREESKQEVNRDQEMEPEDLPKVSKLSKPVDEPPKPYSFGGMSKDERESLRKAVIPQAAEPQVTPPPVQPQAEPLRPPADNQPAPVSTPEPKPRENTALGGFGLFDLDSLPDIPKKNNPPRQPEKAEARPAEDAKAVRERKESQADKTDKADKALSGLQRKRQKKVVDDEDEVPSVLSPNQMPVKKQMSANQMPDKYPARESTSKDRPSHKLDSGSSRPVKTTPKYHTEQRLERKYDDRSKHQLKRPQRTSAERFPSPTHSIKSSNTVNNLYQKRKRSISRESRSSRGARSNIGYDSQSKHNLKDKKESKFARKRERSSKSRNRNRDSSSGRYSRHDRQSKSPSRSKPVETKQLSAKEIARLRYQQYQQNKDKGLPTKFQSSSDRYPPSTSKPDKSSTKYKESSYKEKERDRDRDRSVQSSKKYPDDRRNDSRSNRSMSKERQQSKRPEQKPYYTPTKSPSDRYEAEKKYRKDSERKSIDSRASPVPSKSKFSPRQEPRMEEIRKFRPTPPHENRPVEAKQLEKQRLGESYRPSAQAPPQRKMSSTPVEDSQASKQDYKPQQRPVSPMEERKSKKSPSPIPAESFPEIPKRQQPPKEPVEVRTEVKSPKAQSPKPDVVQPEKNKHEEVKMQEEVKESEETKHEQPQKSEVERRPPTPPPVEAEKPPVEIFSKTEDKKQEEKQEEKHVEKRMEKTIERHVEKPVETPVEKPREKSVEKPTDKQPEKVVEKPVDEPVVVDSTPVKDHGSRKSEHLSDSGNRSKHSKEAGVASLELQHFPSLDKPTPPILEHLSSSGKRKDHEHPIFRDTPIPYQESPLTRALHKDREMPNLSPTNSNFLDKIDSDSDKSPDEDQMEDLGPPLENDAFDPIFNRANSYGREMASVDMKQKDSIDDFNINSPETPREEEEPKMASLYESYMNKQKESLQPSDSEKQKSQGPIDVEMEDDEKPVGEKVAEIKAHQEAKPSKSIVTNVATKNQDQEPISKTEQNTFKIQKAIAEERYQALKKKQEEDLKNVNTNQYEPHPMKSKGKGANPPFHYNASQARDTESLKSSKHYNSNSMDSDSDISEDDPNMQMLDALDPLDIAHNNDRFDDMEHEQEDDDKQGVTLWQKYQEMNREKQDNNRDENMNEEEENHLSSLFDGEDSNDEFGTMLNMDDNIMEGL